MWPGAATAAGCAQGRIRTASGCTALVAARREVEAIVHRQVEANGLRGVLARVDVANRTLARVAAGNSMAGVPTNFRMHFRIGSIAIPYAIDVLLQLQDAGRLSLDDPLSKWLPKLPNADHVTLRMLANSTSGYADWVQENQTFLNTLYANVFRQWTTNELLNIALARPALCTARDLLPLRPHQLHHPGQGDSQRHPPAGGAAAPPTRPAPARLAPHGYLGAARDPATGPALLHRRPRSIRGLDVLEPVVDDRGQHDHDGDDRRRDDLGQGVRQGGVDLQGRRPATCGADLGRIDGIQPEPLLRARDRHPEHLADPEPTAQRLDRDPGVPALEADRRRPRRHQAQAGGRHRHQLQPAAARGDLGVLDAQAPGDVLRHWLSRATVRAALHSWSADR